MNYENIITEIQDRILWVTINREKKLNALNKQTLNEIHQIISSAQDDANIGGIIITGSGEKAFVAGADISEFSNFTSDEGKKLAQEGQNLVFDLIENSTKPVIAAINGFALGGGLELALACQIRIASDNAKLGLPEVTLGLIPGYGGTQRLSKLVGKGKAMEMILTADMISAEEALSSGLINKLTSLDDLKSVASNLMMKILKGSPNAIKAAIKAINASENSAFDGFKVEINEFGNCFGTDDFIEGVDAFLNKRKPNFTR